jgi:hypothetical protein
MWLFKSAFSLVLLLAIAYGLFFVDFAGQPLIGHLGDVWHSDTVQTKIDLVERGVRNELEDRLAAAAERTARDAVRDDGHSRPAEEYAPEDREALERVLTQ